MWRNYEDWQIQELQNLASQDEEWLETILNTLWNSYPGLLQDLALNSVQRGNLSIPEAAKCLHMPESEVESLILMRDAAKPQMEYAVVMDQSVARLNPSQVSIWEVVRQYRKLGSLERLKEEFPGLTQFELAAALRYAELNPSEIESQIAAYEKRRAERLAQYPHSTVTHAV